MHHFFCSCNARYFIFQLNDELNFANGEKILWKIPVGNERIKILGIGNNGYAAILNAEGIRIYGAHGNESLDFIEAFSRSTLTKSSSFLGRTVINEDGTQICLEKITRESKLSGKILGALTQTQSEKDLELHEIIFYRISDKNFGTYYKMLNSVQMEVKPVWNISRDFNFLLLGEPQKMNNGIKMRFSIINVTTDEVWQEFSFMNVQIEKVLINNQGTALIDLVEKGTRELRVVTADGTKYAITPPSSFQILHLGRNFVALMTEPVTALIVKSFEDNMICHADLRALNDFKIPYEILFDGKDEIALTYMMGPEFKVQNSDLERIPIDAKRWEYVSKQHREAEIQEPAEKAEEYKKRAVQKDSLEKKRTALSLEMTKHRDERKKVLSVSREEVLKNLEALKLQFITGQLSEDDYNKAREGLEQSLAEENDTSAIPPRKDSKALPLPSKKTAFQPAETCAPKPSKGGRDTARIEKLLEALEERLILGEISEATYKELKDKYTNSLRGL